MWGGQPEGGGGAPGVGIRGRAGTQEERARVHARMRPTHPQHLYPENAGEIRQPLAWFSLSSNSLRTYSGCRAIESMMGEFGTLCQSYRRSTCAGA